MSNGSNRAANPTMEIGFSGRTGPKRIGKRFIYHTRGDA